MNLEKIYAQYDELQRLIKNSKNSDQKAKLLEVIRPINEAIANYSFGSDINEDKLLKTTKEQILNIITK
jgi:hypothetical protein